ncbi:MAG: hypothetical protein LBI87_15100 [Candidatus Accumulibacter sp.]|nr:hypothetical protein [Accumulibacter sp.]
MAIVIVPDGERASTGRPGAFHSTDEARTGEFFSPFRRRRPFSSFHFQKSLPTIRAQKSKRPSFP